MKLHLGCGGEKLDGYVNVDVRPEVAPDLVVDLTVNWPWPTQTVEEVLSFHLLEHMTRHEGLHFLSEAHRVLHVGGRLILEMPDVLKVCEEYAAGNRERIHNLYGLQRNPYDFHRYGYNPVSLLKILDGIGFWQFVIGEGTDYHAKGTKVVPPEPCFRIEAVRL